MRGARAPQGPLSAGPPEGQPLEEQTHDTLGGASGRSSSCFGPLTTPTSGGDLWPPWGHPPHSVASTAPTLPGKGSRKLLSPGSAAVPTRGCQGPDWRDVPAPKAQDPSVQAQTAYFQGSRPPAASPRGSGGSPSHPPGSVSRTCVVSAPA